ncbi:sigma-B regulation protein RsbU (phosphoserine phosphatase) [Roseovarius halotolerans]|uniref:Phosphate regulon transcriptional regulatory protein PhoB n=1 Tax=Roseovarius halotolerans TaxID=505353 RepID=A0A1X6Z5G6_9RHOB|nr:fused response regulator/phosphatase [Roseovarius halotolerans]RKT32278.1 sigma-B regulation protein RsbU (phosphoserine phosphatase) [Roseovarius halotolerans]SLN39349.1 Phosphate regulon transcriptional regulatory protein PhoB [Roseovarius halotolerans]
MGESVETIEELQSGGQAIRRILVVDDSRVQRKIVSASIRRWGFSVREADSAAEALEICRLEPPDLVLSDWMMPGMTGLEFCREFRGLPREDYGYFILLTSKSEKEEIARGLDAGADDFLTKPVNAAELRARIAAGDRILRMERELIDKNRLIASTLEELQKLYDSLDSDLIEARKLQQSLVSDRYRDLGVADVSLLLRSSGHVGGDLVGMFPVGESRIGLYGIDVSGHGISSALMTARLAGYLSASAPDQNIALFRTRGGSYQMRPPAETIVALNRLILDEMDTEHYFTMVLADVDLARGEVILAQAGHPHPAVQRRNGAVCLVGCGGLPVGLLPDAEYDQVKFHMAPGERLLIHSDGIVECSDAQGRLLGDDGLEAILRDMRHSHGPALLESLIWKLTEFSGADDFQDDVSAVLLEFKPPVAGL